MIIEVFLQCHEKSWILGYVVLLTYHQNLDLEAEKIVSSLMGYYLKGLPCMPALSKSKAAQRISLIFMQCNLKFF